jgi:SanA protein
MKLKKILKKIIKLSFILVVIGFLCTFFANKRIEIAGKPFVYESADSIPVNKVGLLLGTSKFLSNGQENLYYRYRIKAAIELYKLHKISYIVVSGDNGSKTYDEPTQMKADLVAGGVPETAIYLDYAGFRTLDSVIRMREIFGQTDFTIISQKFHNERAVFLAYRNGLNVVAFNAQNVSKHYGFKTNLREKFARVKVFIDLLTKKQPRFLGEKVLMEDI